MVDFTIGAEESFERNLGVGYAGTQGQIEKAKYNEDALETLTSQDFVNTLKD